MIPPKTLGDAILIIKRLMRINARLRGTVVALQRQLSIHTNE